MFNVKFFINFVSVILILSICGSNSQNDIGSGDDDDLDVDPSDSWNKPQNPPNTGWQGRDDRKVSNPSWNSEQAWNKPSSPDSDWEIDGSGDGDSYEVPERVPDVNAPKPQEPTRKQEGDEDDDTDEDKNMGGGGVITDRKDPSDAIQLCSTELYCLNGGTCQYHSQDKKSLCLCAPYFVGARCEHRESGDIYIDEDKKDDSKVQPVKAKHSLLHDIILNPITIAVMAVSGLLLIGLLIFFCVICCRCIRKKDEGSYTLDEALQNPKVEYTKVPNGQEFYA